MVKEVYRKVYIPMSNYLLMTLLFSIINDFDFSSVFSLIPQMSFNLDRTKHAQETIFSKKTRKSLHSNLYFNDQIIGRSVSHKHLGLTLDEKLSLTNWINDKTNKTLKGVNVIRKLSTLLPRQSLLTIYKSFIRSH